VRRLIAIPISHFCEKARWALEWAGLDYVEERHVQGVHRAVAQRAGGGRTVAVLVAPEGVVAESEEILAHADRSVPDERKLFPLEPNPRAAPSRHSATSSTRGSALRPAGRQAGVAALLHTRIEP
jgi:glutathione S-transferase